MIASGLRALRRRAGKAFLDANGWTAEGAPPVKKAVVVAAPHTSNWDLAYTLACAWALDVDINWVGKKELFRGPMGPLMRAVGGVPVIRVPGKNQVERIAAVLEEADELFLIIAPEGTRSRASRWKTGFYRIALAAKVPIVLGYLDYEKKRGGLGTLFHPTGDMAADLERIRAFYTGMRGKFPDKQGEITFED